MRKFGWKPSPVKFKFTQAVAPVGMAPPPARWDIGKYLPPVYDQEDLGSCTANASAALAQTLMNVLGRKVFRPSRLALYYWTRLREGNVEEDTGCSVADACNTLFLNGVPNEAKWAYDTKKFTEEPPINVARLAMQHRTHAPESVKPDAPSIEAMIAQNHPVAFGFWVFKSFDNVGSDGLVPMPKRDEEKYGGHAVCIVGYDRDKQLFKVRNSWGTEWGDKGYCYMPYKFVINRRISEDFWVVRDLKW